MVCLGHNNHGTTTCRIQAKRDQENVRRQLLPSAGRFRYYTRVDITNRISYCVLRFTVVEKTILHFSEYVNCKLIYLH